MSDDESDNFIVPDDEDDFEEISDEEDDFDDKPKKKKAASAPKEKPGSKPPKKKSKVDGENGTTAKPAKRKAPGGSPTKKSPAKPTGDIIEKTIEEIYQKKTPIEHILIRPDTYIGSVEEIEQYMWVYDEGKGMVYRKATIVPGLYKIFDEILVNAADNKQRDPKNMDTIRVEIDVEANRISIENNGQGIPVVIHGVHGVYVPELIFGHLLTSSNYDDSVKKVVGGRNGYGAKLCNIFSTEFIVETCDTKRGKQYKQVFTNNMGKIGEPQVSSAKFNRDWTKITFKPDLHRFSKMSRLTDDMVALMTKRVYDVAGCNPTVKVFLNGKHIPINSFKDYCMLYIAGAKKDLPEGTALNMIHERANERWEVCVAPSDDGFQSVSFVNSICTMKGGTHVNHVVEQLVEHLQKAVAKKDKKASNTLKPHQFKQHLWVFINCLIENPAFDSQTKENMTSKPANFGSSCTLSNKFYKALETCGVVEKILSYAAFRQNQELKKTGGKKEQRVKGITKLEDANEAGGRNAHRCTLILTEGDSAKSLAVAGLSVVGRDYYGVFPLRGKLLNVREATQKQLLHNEEINNLKKIIGLKHGVDYMDVKQLRYGHIMIMADQDHDGSHIKGLVINFIHHFWPSLVRIPGFLCEFITPIVKATRGKEEVTFFTIPEYVNWKQEHNDGKGWSIKYYKGLGTSTAQEAKEYFSELEEHQIDFTYEGKPDDDALELAFSKKKVEERKEWLSKHTPGDYVDHTSKKLSYNEFINKEFILFSLADCVRSIPCMVDGLKPGQRKILFACFKRNLKSDIKVSQLAGYIAEHTAYHHGEASLQATIVGMAQNFVGKNNINLLFPSGQFGTRLQGGKDAASARYIFTRLCRITRKIFNPHDDNLLEYLNDDGLSIEPKWYIPIIPMILVNGSEGIGTGWSTTVPMYNPRDIVANLKRLLNGEPIVPMHPWYRGFQGKIELDAKGKSYRVTGVWEKVDDTTIRVTELPIGTWTYNYKKFLEESMIGNEDKEKEKKKKEGKKKNKKSKKAMTASDEEAEIEKEKKKLAKAKAMHFVQEYKEYHTETKVEFVITIPTNVLAQMEREGTVEQRLHLTTTIPRSNMHLFDPDLHIKKYESPEEILNEFYHLRLEYYHKRKEFLLGRMRHDLEKISNRVRFILMVIDNKLVVSKKKKADLIKELKEKGFKPFPPEKKTTIAAAAIPEDEGEEGEDSTSDAVGYNYLLSMPLWSLTHERVEQLKKEQADTEEQIRRLEAMEAKDMWAQDLDEFLEELKDWEETEVAAMHANLKVKAKGGRRLGGAGKRKKATAADDSDDDFGTGKAKKAPTKPKVQTSKPAAKSEPVKTDSKLTAHAAMPKQLTLSAMYSLAKKEEKPKPTESKPVTSLIDSDDDKPASSSSLPKATEKQPKVKKEPEPKKDNDSDDEELFLPLSQRLQKLAAKPSASSSTSTSLTSSKPPDKKPLVSSLFDVLKKADAKAEKPKPPSTTVDVDRKDEKKPTTSKPAAKKAAGTRKRKQESDDEEDADHVFLFDESDSDEPKKKKKAAAPASTKAKPAAKAETKRTLTVLSSDEEEAKKSAAKASKPSAKVAKKKSASNDEPEEVEDEEDNKKRKNASRKAKKAVSYRVESDSESEEVEDDEEGDDEEEEDEEDSFKNDEESDSDNE